MSIRIHRRVVVTRHCAASVEDGVTVGGDKVAPDIVALRGAGRFLQPRQDEGEVGRMYAVSRSVLRPGMDIASIWLIGTGRQQIVRRLGPKLSVRGRRTLLPATR